VTVWDDEYKQTIELINNNLKSAAQTILYLYKSRWQVEMFFREFKQLLHIKKFIGTTKNVVMIQICSTLIAILLLKEVFGNT
jgi:IS4 transposase